MRRLRGCFLAIQIIVRLPPFIYVLCEICHLILILAYPLILIDCFIVAEETLLIWNFGEVLVLELFSVKANHFVFFYFIFKATFSSYAVFKIPNIKFSYSWRVSYLILEGDIGLNHYFYFLSYCIYFPDTVVYNGFDNSILAFISEIF